jgi:hypothetical protein
MNYWIWTFGNSDLGILKAQGLAGKPLQHHVVQALEDFLGEK